MDLRLAEFEWTDIAGKVDPARTLWYWAWSRFPQLVHDELAGIDETRAVCVSLKNGDCATGYPDARRSQRGELYLVALGKQGTRNSTELGPFAIDQISEVTRS